MIPNERTPTDGRPYYCEVCGAGWSEFVACELPYCSLETVEELEKRALRKAWCCGTKIVVKPESATEMDDDDRDYLAAEEDK